LAHFTSTLRLGSKVHGQCNKRDPPANSSNVDNQWQKHNTEVVNLQLRIDLSSPNQAAAPVVVVPDSSALPPPRPMDYNSNDVAVWKRIDKFPFGGNYYDDNDDDNDSWNKVVVCRNLERGARIQSYVEPFCSLEQHEWQQRALRQEHERVALQRAALCAQPLAAWQKLSKVDKFEKTTILTLLQLNQHGGANRSVNNNPVVDFIDELPIPLTEAYFETSVPKPLIHDRQVLLARMDTVCTVESTTIRPRHWRTNNRRPLTTIPTKPLFK
jgi:hypothetical protein